MIPHHAASRGVEALHVVPVEAIQFAIAAFFWMLRRRLGGAPADDEALVTN